jgi:hypothetical protein
MFTYIRVGRNHEKDERRQIHERKVHIFAFSPKSRLRPPHEAVQGCSFHVEMAVVQTVTTKKSTYYSNCHLKDLRYYCNVFESWWG